METTPSTSVAASLRNKIESVLDEAAEYRIGIALSKAPDGEDLTFGDTSTFTAASTAKILTAAAYYAMVEDGRANLDDPMGNYDASFQLEAMVNKSNNVSWLLLMEAVGYQQLSDYATSIGVAYHPQRNLLTAAEMALILKQLHAGELLNADHTAQLLGYMQDTNYQGLIPAAAGPNIEVHHKYGRLHGRLHDAALLTHRDSTYALVIYTKNPGGVRSNDQIEIIQRLTAVIVETLFPQA